MGRKVTSDTYRTSYPKSLRIDTEKLREREAVPEEPGSFEVGYPL